MLISHCLDIEKTDKYATNFELILNSMCFCLSSVQWRTVIDPNRVDYVGNPILANRLSIIIEPRPKNIF